MNSNLDISIVIAFYNQAKMTIDCVKSIYKYGPSVKEIILVSNNSSPEELRLTQSYAATTPNTRVLIWNYPFNYQKEFYQ
jgi:GT2 family glycosyltransferase